MLCTQNIKQTFILKCEEGKNLASQLRRGSIDVILVTLVQLVRAQSRADVNRSEAHVLATKMAKSIRSKAKRKLRAAKREKLAAKERLKLLAIQEQEEGIKMAVQDTEESGKIGENIPGWLIDTLVVKLLP